MGVAGVAVAVVVVAGLGGHFADRDDAAVEDFAIGVFELDSGVVDVEVLPGEGVDLEQDAVALGRRNVVDGDVAGEGVGLGSEAPDVKVVDVLDALDSFEAGADLRQ